MAGLFVQRAALGLRRTTRAVTCPDGGVVDTGDPALQQGRTTRHHCFLTRRDRHQLRAVVLRQRRQHGNGRCCCRRCLRRWFHVRKIRRGDAGHFTRRVLRPLVVLPLAEQQETHGHQQNNNAAKEQKRLAIQALLLSRTQLRCAGVQVGCRLSLGGSEVRIGRCLGSGTRAAAVRAVGLVPLVVRIVSGSVLLAHFFTFLRRPTT
ncbi:hypothetical protein D3C75_889140 [compost metagenome]